MLNLEDTVFQSLQTADEKVSAIIQIFSVKSEIKIRAFKCCFNYLSAMLALGDTGRLLR